MEEQGGAGGRRRRRSGASKVRRDGRGSRTTPRPTAWVGAGGAAGDAHNNGGRAACGRDNARGRIRSETRACRLQRRQPCWEGCASEAQRSPSRHGTQGFDAVRMPRRTNASGGVSSTAPRATIPSCSKRYAGRSRRCTCAPSACARRTLLRLRHVAAVQQAGDDSSSSVGCASSRWKSKKSYPDESCEPHCAPHDSAWHTTIFCVHNLGLSLQGIARVGGGGSHRSSGGARENTSIT